MTSRAPRNLHPNSFPARSALPSLELVLAVLSAVVGAMMNSIAGAGTLLTFPALVALGMPPINANATSTVALWPGALGSMVGYRAELAGARRWALGFAVPSLLGGALGAFLLLKTPPDRFSAIVPWLVLGATALFMVRGPMMRWMAAGKEPQADSPSDADLTRHWPPPSIIAWQFLVSIYGGYFGAGVGILMLAALGLMGLRNIHRMNGLKNWGGLCMNAVAAAMFAFSSLVHWKVALAMAGGAVTGGYLGSRIAQRVPQALVRAAVVAIGLISGLLLLFSR
jgi:uncharacterized protein